MLLKRWWLLAHLLDAVILAGIGLGMTLRLWQESFGPLFAGVFLAAAVTGAMLLIRSLHPNEH